MKNKRINKMAVPMGLIWWNEMKRHPLNLYVGRVIHRLRTDRGWALEDLGTAAGVTKSYLCDLERGLHSPSLEVQLRLETALGMVEGGSVKLACGPLRRAA
ncbi:MAG: helix-turn-helix transcriptional regulator [Verrucomicrobia bacterium]|nr:helix-turn-helix transcriptional regulator [Verrucomicrobiota bacterium]